MLLGKKFKTKCFVFKNAALQPKKSHQTALNTNLNSIAICVITFFLIAVKVGASLSGKCAGQRRLTSTAWLIRTNSKKI